MLTLNLPGRSVCQGCCHASAAQLTLSPLEAFHLRSTAAELLQNPSNRANASNSYTILLVLPLTVTWLFSVFVCITLWRRRLRLNTSSGSMQNNNNNAPSQRGSFNEKQSNQGGRVTRSTRSLRTRRPRLKPAAEFVTPPPPPPPPPAQEDRHCEYEETNLRPQESLSDESSSGDLSENIAKSDLSLRHKRKAAAADSNRSVEQKKLSAASENRYLAPNSPYPSGGATTDETASPGSQLSAKHMVYRRSWSGLTLDMRDTAAQSVIDVTTAKPVRSHLQLQASLSSPARTSSRLLHANGAVACVSSSPRNFSTSSLNRPCSTKLLQTAAEHQQNPTAGVQQQQHTFQRQQSLRNSKRSGKHQRQSSVRIARNMLRSKSMELSIAKTLLTVVLTFTLASTPIIAVVTFMLARNKSTSLERLNFEVTGLVCCILLLFTNSLWNSLIYGARMPYFKHMLKRTCRYFADNSVLAGCCRKANQLGTNVRRKIDCGDSPSPTAS